jgi:hypothetical protein
MRFVLFSLSALLISSTFSVQAKMYKWVDENGQMHFGDKIPAKYQVKEHEELNDRGLTTKHKKAAKSDEQKAEEQRLEKERKKLAIEEKKKQHWDRVLLDTYTTELDLIYARKSRLDAVEAQIHFAQSIINDSNNQIESLEKSVAEVKASNRAVPDDMYKQVDSQKRQVKAYNNVMEQHAKRREEIVTQFDGYISRFRVLKEEQKAKKEKLAKERAEAY